MRKVKKDVSAEGRMTGPGFDSTPPLASRPYRAAAAQYQRKKRRPEWVGCSRAPLETLHCPALRCVHGFSGFANGGCGASAIAR